MWDASELLACAEEKRGGSAGRKDLPPTGGEAGSATLGSACSSSTESKTSPPVSSVSS